jgi:hypothetical protein
VQYEQLSRLRQFRAQDVSVVLTVVESLKVQDDRNKEGSVKVTERSTTLTLAVVKSLKGTGRKLSRLRQFRAQIRQRRHWLFAVKVKNEASNVDA